MAEPTKPTTTTKDAAVSGEYYRSLERRFLLIVVGLVLIVLAEISLELFWRHVHPSREALAEALVIAPDHPRHLVDFSLIDQAGHPITRKDFEHKIVVVNFLFTSCSLVCPYVSAQMAQIQRKTSDEANVLLLSLSVDPVDDTVPVLAAYSQKLGADPNRWIFATGSEEVMQQLIGTSFLDHDTDTNFSGMPGSFANSQRIALVDTHGEIVQYFDGLNLDAAHAVVQEIHKLERSMP
jgi:cytochrome oxidase Cu insertion factor (SCO1/SenC/PrrC family)